jgi:hypothetical protein
MTASTARTVPEEPYARSQPRLLKRSSMVSSSTRAAVWAAFTFLSERSPSGKKFRV